MKVLAALLLVVPAFSQITVTVLPNSSKTARRTFTERSIPGVAVRNVQVCGTPGTRASASEVIQGAARSGSSLFFPGAIDLLALRRSIAQITLDVSEGLTLGGAFVTSGDVVKLHEDERKEVTSSLIAFSGFAHWLSGKLTASPATSSARLRSMELPQEVVVPAAGCWNGTALGRN